MKSAWAWATGGPIRTFLTYAILGILLWQVGWTVYHDQQNLNGLVVDYIQRHSPATAPTAPTGS